MISTVLRYILVSSTVLALFYLFVLPCTLDPFWIVNVHGSIGLILGSLAIMLIVMIPAGE